MKDAAAALNASTSKISRIETGESPQRVQDVATLLRHYGHHDRAEAAALSELLQQAASPIRRYTACDTASGWAVRLAAIEHRAVAVRMAAVRTVPGSLQVPAYTAALVPRARLGQADMAALLNRRSLVTPGPSVCALIDETVLLQRTGNAATMCAQLRHLRGAAARGEADIRVLRVERGAVIPGSGLTEFTLHGPHGPRLLLAVERVDGMFYTTAPDQIANGTTVLDRLFAQAEPADRSLRILDESILRLTTACT